MRASLHVISDQYRHRLVLEDALWESAMGGVDVIQIRQKKVPAAETYAFARKLIHRCQAAGANSHFFINDRVDVAMACAATGVHLAAKSLPVDAVCALRRQTGWDGMIGCSVHSLAEAQAAAQLGADYITFGHVFPTASHAGLAPHGVSELAKIVRQVALPVIAIGGIDKTNISRVLATGCSGIAVIGAILESAEPRQATALLIEEITNASVRPRIPFSRIGKRGNQ